jgi:hypothetical protein
MDRVATYLARARPPASDLEDGCGLLSVADHSYSARSIVDRGYALSDVAQTATSLALYNPCASYLGVSERPAAAWGLFGDDITRNSALGLANPLTSTSINSPISSYLAASSTRLTDSLLAVVASAAPPEFSPCFGRSADSPYLANSVVPPHLARPTIPSDLFARSMLSPFAEPPYLAGSTISADLFARSTTLAPVTATCFPTPGPGVGLFCNERIGIAAVSNSALQTETICGAIYANPNTLGMSSVLAIPSVKHQEVAAWIDTVVETRELDTQKHFWRFYGSIRASVPDWLSTFAIKSIPIALLAPHHGGGGGIDFVRGTATSWALSVRALKTVLRGVAGAFRQTAGSIFASEIAGRLRSTILGLLTSGARNIVRSRIATRQQISLTEVYSWVRSFAIRIGTPPPGRHAKHLQCMANNGEDSDASVQKRMLSRCLQDAFSHGRSRERVEEGPQAYAQAGGRA